MELKDMSIEEVLHQTLIDDNNWKIYKQEILSRYAELEKELDRERIDYKDKLEKLYIETHNIDYISKIVKPYEDKIKEMEEHVELIKEIKCGLEMCNLELKQQITSLSEQVEQLKCCGNCKHYDVDQLSQHPNQQVCFKDKGFQVKKLARNVCPSWQGGRE